MPTSISRGGYRADDRLGRRRGRRRATNDDPVGRMNAANVAEAIARVQPHMVDVSSGVESEPGRKDLDKLKEFFAAVAAA